MTSDYFSNNSTSAASSSVLTREKIKEMMDSLQLPPIEKPFLKNYLGEFPKFEYVTGRKQGLLKARRIDAVIIHNTYPYYGFPHVSYTNNKIRQAAKKLLSTFYAKDTGGDSMNNIGQIGDILMMISEHPDEKLSDQKATLLCQGIAKHLDDEDKEIVDAAYDLLAHFLPQVGKEVRDTLIPAMVVHDL